MEIDNEYLLLQANYREKNKNKDNIFPEEWYNVQEYGLKKEILSECLEKDILIIHSSKYSEFKLKALNDHR